MKKRFCHLLFLVMVASFSCVLYAGGSSEVSRLCEEYIDAWKRFYPSRAFSLGYLHAVFDFEDISQPNIQNWLKLNKSTLSKISRFESSSVTEDRIDARLLRGQIQTETEKWELEAPHKNRLSLYSDLIARALESVIDSDLLMPGEKFRIIAKRLESIAKLCDSGIRQLENGSSKDVERGLGTLGTSADFIENKLPEVTKLWMLPEHLPEFTDKCRDTSTRIRALITYVRTRLVPKLSKPDSMVLGREEFARRLRLYTDSGLTPEELERSALREIRRVRGLIVQVCKEYVHESYPARKGGEDVEEMMNIALGDMEKNHPSGQQEYLRFWEGLAEKAEDFIRDKKIATLPDNRTLSIRLAPESSGPMARIGWVSPAPPFHPNPWTTIYLPNIPDSHPEKEKKDFWRSFNNHFTTFIIIHELFPGHYIQSKINRENPHPVRILFPCGLYSEGWATLCERVALDAGWDDHNKLTYLAHLRKRIENANRAYTSVQVHCNGWDREKVHQFSVDTSLLAPQFAKSLWGRLMRSPIQITSYFLGTQKFTELYEDERKRLGDKFRDIDFMDTILRAGPIPLDEFPAIFENQF